MSNTIDATAIVGPDVKMGTGNFIGPYCVLSGKVEIGDGNKFLSHVRIGSPPEHRGFHLTTGTEETSGVIRIGSHNTFFEFVSVNQPYEHLTVIGSNGYFMAGVYIPHDCCVGDGVTIANGCTIGGHSHLQSGCNLGFQVSVHQFCTIGAYAMIGMGSIVLHDVRPFGNFVGVGPRRIGMNAIGLERAGLDQEELNIARLCLENANFQVPEGGRIAEIVREYREFSKRPFQPDYGKFKV